MQVNAKAYQKRLVEYLHSVKTLPLSLLVQDSCSEIARLLGYWILAEEPVLARIFKGTNLTSLPSHDVLVLTCAQNMQIWDPTIWQIRPHAQSILVDTCHNEDDICSTLTKHYGGRWHLSEILEKQVDDNYLEQLESVIRANIG